MFSLIRTSVNSMTKVVKKQSNKAVLVVWEVVPSMHSLVVVWEAEDNAAHKKENPYSTPLKLPLRRSTRAKLQK